MFYALASKLQEEYMANVYLLIAHLVTCQWLVFATISATFPLTRYLVQACGKYSWRTGVTVVLHEAFEVMQFKLQTNMLKIKVEKACRHATSE